MYSNVSLCGSLSNQQCNFLFQEVVQTPPPGSLLPPVSVSRNLPERNVMQQYILGQAAVQCRPPAPPPSPAIPCLVSFLHSNGPIMPKCLCTLHSSADWNGEDQDQDGEGVDGQGREGGARRSNIIHCALRSNCTSMQPIWHTRCVPRKYLLLECGIIWLAGCPIRFPPRNASDLKINNLMSSLGTPLLST